MYFLLSPAKKLNENPAPITAQTKHPFPDQTRVLLDILDTFSPQQLAELMHLSDRLALLNVERFAKLSAGTAERFPAIFLFNGDAYEGLDARTLNNDALGYLQKNLGILSGLYGLLRPLDAIAPYRLEMGTVLNNTQGANLYQFWGDRITLLIQERMVNNSVLVNVASQEYFSAVRENLLSCRVVTPIFKDWSKGQYKMISFYAKRARGLMVRFAAEHQLENVEDLQNFDIEGYSFSAAHSDENRWIFLRKQ